MRRFYEETAKTAQYDSEVRNACRFCFVSVDSGVTNATLRWIRIANVDQWGFGMFDRHSNKSAIIAELWRGYY